MEVDAPGSRSGESRRRLHLQERDNCGGLVAALASQAHARADGRTGATTLDVALHRIQADRLHPAGAFTAQH